MKRIAALTSVLAALGLLLIPLSSVLADQAFQTVKLPYYTAPTADPSEYPLKNGFVVSTHMNGPNYFEKKEFQLHGAKPNTQLFIYRVFPSGLGPIPPNVPVYSGFSFWTDEHGNGHITTPLAPDNASLVMLKAAGITSAVMYNLLYDGLLVKDGGAGGTLAYQTDSFTTCFDWGWTP
jgi:hypothetical protein